MPRRASPSPCHLTHVLSSYRLSSVFRRWRTVRLFCGLGTRPNLVAILQNASDSLTAYDGKYRPILAIFHSRLTDHLFI